MPRILHLLNFSKATEEFREMQNGSSSHGHVNKSKLKDHFKSQPPDLMENEVVA